MIRYLCINIEKNFPGKEWIACPFYSYEGSIDDPENLILRLEDIYLQSIDDSSFTKYTVGNDFSVDFLFDEDHPMRVNGWRYGLMHSHHNMDVFFSGTDNDELKQGTPDHDVYLSVIVNNAGDIIARLCTEVESVRKSRDVNGEMIEYSHKYIGYWECEIHIEYPVPDYLKDRFKECMDDAKSHARPVTHYYNRNRDLPPLPKKEEKDNQIDWDNAIELGNTYVPPTHLSQMPDGDYHEKTMVEDIEFVNDWYNQVVFSSNFISAQKDVERFVELVEEALKLTTAENLCMNDITDVVEPKEYLDVLISAIDNGNFINERVVNAMKACIIARKPKDSSKNDND